MWSEETINSIRIACDGYPIGMAKARPSHEDGVVNLNYIDNVDGIIKSITEIKSLLIETLKIAEKAELICKEEYDNYLKEVRSMMEKRGIIANSVHSKDSTSAITSNNDKHNSEDNDKWVLVGPKKKSEARDTGATGNTNSTHVVNPPAIVSHVAHIPPSTSRMTNPWAVPKTSNTIRIQTKNASEQREQREQRPEPQKNSLVYKTENVHITDKLFIPNVRTIDGLPDLSKIRQTSNTVPHSSPYIDYGQLYYSRSADTFFMVMNPGAILIYGNIGEITPPIDYPFRVKDCKYLPCKHDNCMFYHNPFQHSGKRDHRNYISGSWEYTGALAGQRRQGEQSRMIGSRSNLDIDIDIVSSASLDIYGSQLMHDILVYLLCKLQ